MECLWNILGPPGGGPFSSHGGVQLGARGRAVRCVTSAAALPSRSTAELSLSTTSDASTAGGQLFTLVGEGFGPAGEATPTVR